MPSDSTAVKATPKSASQVVYEIIAEKVRTDSRDLARLTHVEELAPLLPDMTPEEIVNYLTELYEIEEFHDILATVSTSGEAFLYSSSYIFPEEAREKCLAELVRAKVAGQVRENSKEQARLTPVDSLPELFPDLTSDQVAKWSENIREVEEYADIRPLAGPTGIQYLFSETYITPAYAALLGRADAKDPVRVIADTVREESRVYPRPTKVTLFYEPVFQIEADRIQEAVERTLARVDCADIQKIIATTGAVYLYSNRYMPPGQAERWVQWEEVERYQNP